MRHSAILALALCAIVGCHDGTGPEDILRVSVAIMPGSVGQLDTATIIVSLANLSARPVTIAGSSTCRFGYELSDSVGTIVSSYLPTVCTADLSPLTLRPGEREAWVSRWRPVRQVGGVVSALPAGIYHLRGVSLWTGRWSVPQPFEVRA